MPTNSRGSYTERRGGLVSEKAHGKKKRYTLVIPAEWHEELQRVADREGITFKDFIVKSLKLGVIVSQLNPNNGEGLIIREKDASGKITERKVLLV